MGLGVHKNKRQLHGDIPGEGKKQHEELMTMQSWRKPLRAHPRLPHHTYPPRDTTSFTLTLYDTRIPSTSLLAPSFTLQQRREGGSVLIALCPIAHPWGSHQDPE